MAGALVVRLREREAPSYLWYVWTVVVAGAAVLAAALAATPPGELLGPTPIASLCFIGFLLLGELQPIKWMRRRDGGEVTVSWTFACGLLLVATPAAAMACMAAASLLGDLTHRKPPIRAAFNAGQVTLSLAAGAVVLSLAPGRGLLDPSGPSVAHLAVLLAAAAAIFLVNGFLTCIVLALYQRAAVWPVVRRGVLCNLSTDGLLLAMAPVFVVVADRSILLLPLLLITAWAVYRTACEALSRQHDATHDQLTDLPNRRLFEQQVDTARLDAQRRGDHLAVLLLDLDGFKEINDRLGHHVGDLLLKEVGRRLEDARRPTDVVARLGGDEFAVLLRSVESSDHALALAEGMLRLIERPYEPLGFPVSVGGSFGVALYPDDAADTERLLQHADVAMYTAKRSSSHVEVYDERDEWSPGRFALLAELNDALESEQLILHFQPQQDLVTGEIVAVEALVRWEHPGLGTIGPQEFMPLAEHTDLMGPLTDYVMRLALTRCASWRRRGMDVRLAVNVSARNLQDVRFPATVARLLKESGVPPEALELEITENSVMSAPDRILRVLAELRRLGVTLTIDDFGTGYSSLSNLRDLPVDRIKIDRSFVTNMSTNHGDAVIVRSTIELARNLGLEVVAEGVETLAVTEGLRILGCDILQGYHVAPPVAGPFIENWLAARETPRSLPLAAAQ